MTEFNCLCRAIEKEVRRTLSAPSDFKWLSLKIEDSIHEHISHTTLMRVWGYLPGVTPRKVTLDLLARFIGYLGYDDFMAHQVKDSQEEAPIPEEKTKTGTVSKEKPATEDVPTNDTRETKGNSRRKLWIVAAIALGIIFVGIFLWLRPSTSQKPLRIVSLSQIKNTKQYFIRTRNNERGALGIYQRQIATTFNRAKAHRCDTASTFAILKFKGDYYLYSIADRRFINIYGHETDAPIDGYGTCMKVSTRDSLFVLDFCKNDTLSTLNMNEDYGICLTDWGTTNGKFDVGNQFIIEEAGDFDPTEAFSMMQETNQEVMAASKSIEDGGTYAIYTETTSPNGKTGQKIRHYLHANGSLSDKLTDSCRFVLHRREGQTFYRKVAFHVCYHGKNATKGKECQWGFTSQGETDIAHPYRCGHLEVKPYEYADWQSQVFFLNTSGYYAIRATAMSIEWWGAATFWTVNYNNGKPEAGYSLERAYIWRMEKLS